MDEYSYDSVIIDPTKEGIESIIGKEVYFSDIPHVCLENANLNDFHYLGILEQIRKDGNAPFKVKGVLSTAYWSCIIIKKEPESEYVPFKSKEEFVERYKEVMEGVEFGSFEDNLFLCGMWLKHADDDPNKSVYRLVSQIKDVGVRISEWGFFDWGELLLAGFLFLDDTPCGRRKNDKD